MISDTRLDKSIDSWIKGEDPFYSEDLDLEKTGPKHGWIGYDWEGNIIVFMPDTVLK